MKFLPPLTALALPLPIQAPLDLGRSGRVLLVKCHFDVVFDGKLNTTFQALLLIERRLC